MRFRKHIPNFVDVNRPPDFVFDNRRELTHHLFEQFPDTITAPNFHRLSVTEEGRLMLEFDKCEVWYVAGNLFGTQKEIDSLCYPKFKTPKAVKLAKDSAGEGDFDVAHNLDTKLWEIVDRKKGRKIGACLHRKDIPQLIQGYQEGNK